MQRSFDDLGTPLAHATFCVLDLETTGASADSCGITEIGAVRVRGGELLGTFHTLVNPGAAIPPAITVLTGITEAMVLPAPPIDRVLPTLLEFVGGSVVVGHNVRFDLAFLHAAMRRCFADRSEYIGDPVKRTNIAAVASHVERTGRFGALDFGEQPFAQPRIDATEPETRVSGIGG